MGLESSGRSTEVKGVRIGNLRCFLSCDQVQGTRFPTLEIDIQLTISLKQVSTILSRFKPALTFELSSALNSPS